MLTSRLPPAACPHCGALLDACTSLDGDHQPSPGDWTVCIECAGVSRWDASFNLRAPEREAFADITDSERALIENGQRAVRAMKRLTS